MTKTEFEIAEYSTVAEAPAEVTFDCLADVSRWPQVLTPIVHAEYLRRSGTHETIVVWELSGTDSVRIWQADRTVDRAALRIAFTADQAPVELAALRGEWVCRPLLDGATRLTLRLEYRAADPATALSEVDKYATERLAELKGAAERAGELTQLTIGFEDPLYVAGATADTYEVLYRADRWPEKLDHVLRLDLVEDTPGIQFFEMDTRSADGSEHTTRSVRVCLPQRLIVYKQIAPPPLLEVHTGHWAFTPTPEGVILGARHTCTIRPDKLHVIGADTVLDARRYLRRVLSANSTTNLRLAKTYAEERYAGNRAAGDG